MAYLRLRNLSVEFPIYQGGTRSLKKALVAASSRGNLARDAVNRVTVRALDSLSLDIEHGARVGLIGPNGAGKTTLLKVLAQIYEPSQGFICTEGAISSLLEIQAGLNPEATGRENIILRGMLMGIHPRVMRRHIDSIIDFTGLDAYIDMPVRTYSAGMMIRLAFAIATSRTPEILLMDEWLAAGDSVFLAKAQQRLETFVRQSNILVLASHSIPLLEQWCDRAIFLWRGQIKAIGGVNGVVAEYQKVLASEGSS